MTLTKSLLLAAMCIVCLSIGCAGMPTGQAPAATVAPVNEGTIESQTIDQTQETIANHALDAGRVELEIAEQRRNGVLIAGGAAILLGLYIIAVVMPSALSVMAQYVGYIIALALMIAALFTACIML